MGKISHIVSVLASSVTASASTSFIPSFVCSFRIASPCERSSEIHGELSLNPCSASRGDGGRWKDSGRTASLFGFRHGFRWIGFEIPVRICSTGPRGGDDLPCHANPKDRDIGRPRDRSRSGYMGSRGSLRSLLLDRPWRSHASNQEHLGTGTRRLPPWRNGSGKPERHVG